MTADSLPVLEPNLQISFYYRLQAMQEMYLHQALRATVENIDLELLDDQLICYVNERHLRCVASSGLRGEIFFPVPCVIEANPALVGYYRLLYGLSQKEFYNKGPFGRFKRLEESGDLTDALKNRVPAFCSSLARTGELLVEGIDDLSLAVVRDLQILTLGPQLRGSENTRLGQDATRETFSLIKQIAGSYVRETTERTIIIENDSERTVLIEFSSDPDVRVVMKLESNVRPLVSMEIKGGADASNIHNRLGEAEKSHQKARNRGFFEFWTILRVDVDFALARRESPTTSHFFHLDRIVDTSTSEHQEFKELLGSLLGIQV